VTDYSGYFRSKLFHVIVFVLKLLFRYCDNLGLRYVNSSIHLTSITLRKMSSKALSASTINENMKKCRYDVRGEIYLAAVKRTEEGKEVIYTNVGNPQALGQVPITFNRQVMALLMAPFMMDDPYVHSMFASDAISRAKLYLSKIKG